MLGNITLIYDQYSQLQENGPFASTHLSLVNCCQVKNFFVARFLQARLIRETVLAGVVSLIDPAAKFLQRKNA